MRINANIASLNASRNLSVSQAGLEKSLEKLSSGFRINRAADDAAGLAISEGLRTQIRGNTQAQRNAQDGVSFIQTAEGALPEVHSMLQRMSELSVQAANGTSDGTAEKLEIDALVTGITDIGNNTKFGNTVVFGGGPLDFQTGAEAGEVTTVTVAVLTPVLLGISMPQGKSAIPPAGDDVEDGDPHAADVPAPSEAANV
jgi:flagellin